MNTTAPEQTLIVENLSCRYLRRQTNALAGISFEVGPGQIILVAGASGCGKTTLLRCINGLIPRSYQAEISGRILLHGEDYRARPLAEISRIVGTVLQDPERQILGAFVRNEVAFGLENLNLPRTEIQTRVSRILDYLQISHLINRETFSLSGGEKQKVALAGVLTMEPSLIALDEPLANLDPASAQDALALIRRLADNGKSILIIEHRVEDVISLRPDLVIQMDAGRMTYIGALPGLLEKADFRKVKLPAEIVIGRANEISSPPPLPPASPNRRSGEILVEFQDVSFHYPAGPPVIEDVSLQIQQGDLIALLGANGAGKTTLVKHAIGLLRPTRGKVLLNGRDSSSQTIAEMAAEVGYVFQNPRQMLFAPTVRQELAFGPTNLGHSPETIETNSLHALQAVNLLEEIDHAPLALSFGQQKRASIAAVLAMGSGILVMDEPTAGQDYANYMNFMDAVVGLGGAGPGYQFKSIIFITHDLDLAVSYANRVLLMRAGRIAADGSPRAVLSDFGLLQRCRVLPTSLLRANLEHRQPEEGFLRIENLAHAIRNQNYHHPGIRPGSGDFDRSDRNKGGS